MSSILSTLGSAGRLPVGSPVSDTYVTPMDLSAGIAFHPNLGKVSKFFDPTVQVDLQDIIAVLREGDTPWKMLHAGAEIRLASFFAARAGLDQGYLTFGAGLKLFFLDLNLGVFTRELGTHLGDIPNAGVTVDLALRF
jgi:hypothetical protein